MDRARLSAWIGLYLSIISLGARGGGGGNTPFSYNCKTVKKTLIEDVEYDLDELPDSDFAKATARLFDKIDHGKYGFLPPSKFVDFIETLGEVFHSEDLAGRLHKVDPNESVSLDYFSFVRWYVEKELSLDSTEEAEYLVGWSCKVILIDLK